MKKLNRLQINSDKIMKSEELMTLRGGYGEVGCICKKDSYTLCSTNEASNCDEGYGSCKQWCAYYCPDYDSAICVGW